MQDQEKQPEKSVSFGLRAYPSDANYFRSLYDKFGNQPEAFRAVLSVYKSADPKTPSGEQQIAAAELEEARMQIDALNAKINELTAELAESKIKLSNPLAAELTEPVARAMRKVRPFLIKKGLIKDPDNYKNSLVNLSVKYLLETEYSHLL
jgi:hypothetical protein